MFRLFSLMLVAVVLAGCAATPSRLRNLPPNARAVGGGFSIDYVAPEDGTAIYGDEAQNRVLMTKSLKKGERFTSTASPSDPATKEVLGDLNKARLVLYFAPAQ